MWQEADRQIFPYVVQGQQLWADPIRVLRLLLQHTQGRLNDLCRQANRLLDQTRDNGPPPAEPGTPEYVLAQESRGRLADAAVAAFGLPPFDPFTGQGVLENEAFDVLVAFMDWQEQKKTTGGTTT